MPAARFVRHLLLVGLALGYGGSPAVLPAAHAGDETCTEADLRSRTTKLRRRASDWWQTRKRLVFGCPQCKGQGKVRAGRRRIVDCPKCDGHRKVVDAKRYRKLFYDMRSPAFRRIDGIQDRVTAAYEAARTGSPWPTEIERYHIDGVELVGARHGLVLVERNREDVAKPQRWVWTEDDRGRCAWYLWDQAADGRWVGEAGEPGGAAGTAAGGTPPLTAPPEIRQLVVEMLEPSLTAFVPREVLVQGDTLLLRLLARPGAEAEAGNDRIGADGVALVRALFPVLPNPSIRADWYMNMRDEVGRTEIRPKWTSVLTRERHDRVVWENLSEIERTRMLQWTTYDQDGWILWPMPDPLPDGVLPPPVLPGADPAPAAADEVAAWVDYQGYAFPPRGAREHAVPLSSDCSMTLDVRAVLCTARFDVRVYQEPEPVRARAGEVEACQTRLALFLPPNAPGKRVPAWVGIRLYVTHAAGVAIDANVAERVTAWADDVHVSGGTLGPVDRVSSDPNHEAFTVLWEAPLASALKMARARGVLVRFGGAAGLTIALGEKELAVFEDVLSRVVPE